MLQLEEVDYAIAGGVSESIHTFGIFAGFKSQVALGAYEFHEKVSRPFDRDRNGIVVSEGGCLYILETLEHALKRGVDKIYGEIVGYANNSDTVDFVLPDADTPVVCMQKALDFAGIKPEDIDILNSHATSTPIGDQQVAKAINMVFADSDNTFVNNTKGYIGHAMGAAGALELAGNLPSFNDNIIHLF
jgi:3-oxoacyl-[acyl-carrier-protein] synthase II